MKSYVQIALSENKRIRIYCANTTQLCEDARLAHNLKPTSLAALGRLLSASATMACMLKDEDQHIILQVNGNGPIGTMMAVAKNNGECKGFCGDNELYLKYNNNNKLAVGLVVGQDGYLKVTKTGLRIDFTGQVKLQTGEIGDDLAFYFSQSEQTPSIVSLGVLVDVDYHCKAAGALIIQLLPNHTEEDIVYLENILKDMQNISSLIDGGLSCTEIIQKYFDKAIMLEQKTVFFKCDCSKANFLAKLTTLGLDDLKHLMQDEDLDLKCEYCNTHYKIKSDEIKELINYVSNKRFSS